MVRRVVDVAEDDGLGWTGLLASRRGLALAHLSLFLLGRDLRFLDALHAVGAFLHHAARTHSHVRVALHLQLRRRPILVEIEVEAAHLVWTVVRAIARADAAVVDLIVQAL